MSDVIRTDDDGTRFIVFVFIKKDSPNGFHFLPQSLLLCCGSTRLWSHDSTKSISREPRFQLFFQLVVVNIVVAAVIFVVA